MIGTRNITIGPHISLGIGGASTGGVANVIPGLGDSNLVGIGVADTADRDFGVTVANAGWQINSRYAASVGAGSTNTYTDYPAFRTLANGSLYAASSGQSMGFEMSIATALIARGMPRPVIPKMGVVGATLAVEYNPTGSYPAAGTGNLFNQCVAQFRAIAAAVGGRIGAVWVSLGTNDAASGPQSAAFQANMGTFCPALRTALSNPNLLICWIKTNPDPLGNANTNAVIDAQVAYAATDPLCLLVDQADCLLVSDHLHNTANSYLTVGQRVGSTIATALGYARQTVTTAPNWIGFGPVAASATNPVGVSYGDELDGDLQVATLRMQQIGATVPTAATPSGWTLLGTPVVAGSTAGGVTEALYVFTRPVTTALLAANGGHMPSTTWVTTNGTGNAVKIRTLRGPSLNPTVDTMAYSASNAINTGPIVVPALTAGAANTRVAVFTGGFCGSAGSMTETNATLAGFVEYSDTTITIAANNITDAMASGTLAAAGSSGTFSCSSTANVIQANAVVSFKP